MGEKSAGEVKNTALVLAGSVAMGAFGAGALAEVMASTKLNVIRVVGASSGALNGAWYAAAVRSGASSGEPLVDLWAREAYLWNVLSPSLTGLLRLRGVSDLDGLLAILKDHVPDTRKHHPNSMALCMPVTTLDGADRKVGSRWLSTHEWMTSFADRELESKRQQMLQAAVASAAFPGLFTPVALHEQVRRNGQQAPLGLCVDGGAVNNTPFKYALQDPAIEQVVVITPYPAISEPMRCTGGLAILGRVVHSAINERLLRDLKDAEEVNDHLVALQKIAKKRRWKPATLDELLAALDWQDRRPVDILTIRPDHALPGDEFSGFLDGDLRLEHVDLGRATAHRRLQGAGLL